MGGTVVWIVSTAAFWLICTIALTAIEAVVHNYWTRFAVMVLAGVAIGALASAFGYVIFVLAFILFGQLALIRKRLMRATGNDNSMTRKYMAPSVALVVAATAGSYVFSMEACQIEGPCHRVFFERIYTPPHMVLPAER